MHWPYNRGETTGAPPKGVLLGMLEPYDGKLSRTVLRGTRGRKAPWSTRCRNIASREQMSRWWIDEPIVMGSSNPSDADLRDLRAQGFATLVCLLDPTEQSTNYRKEEAGMLGYSLREIPVRDFHPPSSAQLLEFVTLAHTASDRARVLVHCQGGTGRTGTMASAYWISKGLSKDAAVARVRQMRSGAVETQEQHGCLEEFEHEWRKRQT